MIRTATPLGSATWMGSLGLMSVVFTGTRVRPDTARSTVVRTTDPTVAGVAATFLLDLPVVAGDQLLAFLDEVGAWLVGDGRPPVR